MTPTALRPLGLACWVMTVLCFVLSQFGGRPAMGRAVIPFLLLYLFVAARVRTLARRGASRGPAR